MTELVQIVGGAVIAVIEACQRDQGFASNIEHFLAMLDRRRNQGRFIFGKGRRTAGKIKRIPNAALQNLRDRHRLVNQPPGVAIRLLHCDRADQINREWCSGHGSLNRYTKLALEPDQSFFFCHIPPPSQKAIMQKLPYWLQEVFDWRIPKSNISAQPMSRHGNHGGLRWLLLS